MVFYFYPRGKWAFPHVTAVVSKIRILLCLTTGPACTNDAAYPSHTFRPSHGPTPQGWLITLATGTIFTSKLTQDKSCFLCRLC